MQPARLLDAEKLSWGCAVLAPGRTEEPTPSQVGWNMLIAQVPNLLAERNSREAKPLQHGFLPSPALLSALSGSGSGTGFHSVIISSGPKRTSQASWSFVCALGRQWRTRVPRAQNCATPLTQELSWKSPAPQELDQAGEELAASVNVLSVSKPLPIRGLRERADTASTLSH